MTARNLLGRFVLGFVALLGAARSFGDPLPAPQQNPGGTTGAYTGGANASSSPPGVDRAQ